MISEQKINDRQSGLPDFDAATRQLEESRGVLLPQLGFKHFLTSIIVFDVSDALHFYTEIFFDQVDKPIGIFKLALFANLVHNEFELKGIDNFLGFRGIFGNLLANSGKQS